MSTAAVSLKAICIQGLYLTARNPDASNLEAEMLDDHSPQFEPYAPMSRERIAELMDHAFRAGDHRKWLMLGEFIRDKMDIDELVIDNLTHQFIAKIIEETECHSYEAVEAIASDACDFVAHAVRKVREHQGGRPS